MTPAVQVGLALFGLGLAAVALRGRLLAMLLGLELMIAGVTVILTYQAGVFGDPAGLAAVVLIIAVAAAEAVVGLCLILRLHHAGLSGEASSLSELRE
ncbi:MAG: NADH-quinone oxidoreductase subunit K [Elusimicrobia bacterium]|nr:NADH-quinone oxidoreductase subunit K [Elusimicrobiota bacterium]